MLGLMFGIGYALFLNGDSTRALYFPDIGKYGELGSGMGLHVKAVSV